MVSTSVLLPAPFGPSRVVISLGGITRSTPCSTGRSPRGTCRSVTRKVSLITTPPSPTQPSQHRSSQHRSSQHLGRAQIGGHHAWVAQHLGRRSFRDDV